MLSFPVGFMVARLSHVQARVTVSVHVTARRTSPRTSCERQVPQLGGTRSADGSLFSGKKEVPSVVLVGTCTQSDNVMRLPSDIDAHSSCSRLI